MPYKDKILIDLPEKIESNRLSLQMPRAGFGEAVHAAMMDGYEDYVKWLNWPAKPPTIEEVEIECRKHHADFITKSFIRYLIIEKKSQKVVGRTAIASWQAKWSIRQFGIAYFISRSYRGRGYATEAVAEMTKMCFDYLLAQKVEIFCESENINSKKIPQKLGFQHEYTQKGGWLRHDNSLAELECYALFNKENLI